MKSDLDRLYRKTQNYVDSIDQRRQAVERIKEHHKTKLIQTKTALDPYEAVRSGSLKRLIISRQVQPNSEIMKVVEERINKNPTVGDVEKMMFEKKFKNYLNHRQQFREKARRRREKIIQDRQQKVHLEPGEDYFNEQQVLSNTDSEYQYADATDMYAAYQQIATGKKYKKGGVPLFHSQKIQFALRLSQFQMLLQVQQSQTLISKDLFLNYLFDVPCIMMLYSINPYTIADQLADQQTKTLDMMSFEEFSTFLLIDRAPTYFEYSKQNLEEARKIGRGLKCAPIVGKWIAQEGIYQWLIDIFKSIDIFGRGEVETEILAKKLFRQAENKRLLDEEVIQVVNIGKKLPLRRLLYEIQHEQQDHPLWSIQEFENYLECYKRLHTPDKDKLITQLIMAGRFDPTYIYVVSGQVLRILKEIFRETQKFAQVFVLRDTFIEKLFVDSRYPKIRTLFVRSESNRYVPKQTVQETLIRMHSEAEKYIDIEEILDFFTNRGRPNLVEHLVYLTNLQRQLDLMAQQQYIRLQVIENGGVSSSDEEYAKEIKLRKVKRKKEKLAMIHSSYNYKTNKKLNVTIPISFRFDNQKKSITIREKKLRKMLQEKRLEQQEALRPIKPKEVPKFVKDNLYERIMKDQQKQRVERLQKFRLQIQNSMVPISQHLVAPKHFSPHCDFSREQYKFVARPMPWYCEVNLLDRINRQKQERRERILQEILNRHQDNDLPYGVQQMLDRHNALQEKRMADKGTSSTITGDLTFMPKITNRVPDFKTIHEHLKVDLDIAKQNRPTVHPEPFSFQNRPKKSRTTHEPARSPHQYHMHKSRQRPIEEAQINIPVTMKYEAMVQLRRKEAADKQKIRQQQERANQIRKLRQDKFAPYVRSVLRKKDHDLGKSRQQIEQRIREFRRDQRQKKQDYQKQMIKIYTKVFNRPLLVETMGQFGENQLKKMSHVHEDHHHQEHNKQERRPVKAEKSRPPNSQYNVDYDQRRKRVIEQQPGQYVVEGAEEEDDDDDRYDEDNFQQQFMSEHGHYTN